jgi:hypothetical protein
VARLIVLTLAVLAGSVGQVGAQQFQTFVEVSPFADGDQWFLTEELRYEVFDTGVVVPVPRGFVTDFASVPRPFWAFLPKWGKYGPASIVHDYLYWDQRCTREQADSLMLLAMKESDVSAFRRWLIHRALRWGGSMAWRNNASARTDGLLREMVRRDQYPANPTVTWKVHQKHLFDRGDRPDTRPSPDPPPDYCAQVLAAWQRVLVAEK